MMHTLYVGGLPRGANAQMLERLFAPIAGLQSARVVTDDDGSCRGFGYVTFDSRDAVLAARQLDGTDIEGGTLRIAPAR